MSPAPSPPLNHQIRRTRGRRDPGMAGLAKLHARRPPSSDLAPRACGDDPRDVTHVQRRLAARAAKKTACSLGAHHLLQGGVALASVAAASDPGAPHVGRGAEKILAATFLGGRTGSPATPSGSGEREGGEGGVWRR